VVFLTLTPTSHSLPFCEGVTSVVTPSIAGMVFTENETFGVQEMHIAKRAKRANFFIILYVFRDFAPQRYWKLLKQSNYSWGKRGDSLKIFLYKI
jgi:hypothetical protein